MLNLLSEHLFGIFRPNQFLLHLLQTFLQLAGLIVALLNVVRLPHSTCSFVAGPAQIEDSDLRQNDFKGFVLLHAFLPLKALLLLLTDGQLDRLVDLQQLELSRCQVVVSCK